MLVDNNEVSLLNFYRASELHGGLILGQMVRRTRDAELIMRLTRHSAEEVMHALLWTETIVAVGGKPTPVRDTYQNRYVEIVGTPLTLLEVLALTQVFERRVYRHFMLHLRRPGVHPEVTKTLQRMIEEERGHLSWVKHWLDDQSRLRGKEVADVIRRYQVADQRVYDTLSVEYGFRSAA
ncbi:MAG TPA: ferritin-like domain-containing protein [Gemmatimonadaceae bacterium]|nr:ferritin-like domain-containing protein [Gemmatimonadaceae bacterium]